MTGWDWANQVSKWVAYDFDAIVGHSEKHLAKLTNEELENVRREACEIDWVTIRKSASGKGLHLYVLLDDVPTENHNEHAALARAILGKMSALAGFDFQSRVDICGGNMWIWHRKGKGTDGFQCIKQGKILTQIPPNWRDHVQVITRKRRKNLPHDINPTVDDLSSQNPNIPLDEDHKKLVQYLKEIDALWWWDQDHHMLITHTFHLQQAYEELSFKGYFKTDSKGTEKGTDHNCFLFPMHKGAWSVRRYSLGVQEHHSWQQDSAGWTRCYLNRDCDLGTAARAYGGIEDESGAFIFRTAEMAIQAAQLLGVHIAIGAAQQQRPSSLKVHRDGRLVIKILHEPHDKADEMELWQVRKKEWVRIYGARLSNISEPEVGNYDHLVRHLVTTSDEDYGWLINSDKSWRTEPLTHVRAALGSIGLNGKEITGIIGGSIFKCWKLVNKPFQPEYPGDREWNQE